ncbi:MAG: bifunctional nuclease family protein [candidate division WOR-3 bacterium]
MKNLIQVEIFRVLYEPNTKTNLVLLKEIEGQRILPVSIGIFEAEAIARALHGITFERPLTHDLIKNLIKEMGGTLEKVIINDLKDNVFYARLIIRKNGEILSLDARPSDSICIATLWGCPIFVGAQVMEKAGVDMDELPPEEEDLDEGPPEGYA